MTNKERVQQAYDSVAEWHEGVFFFVVKANESRLLMDSIPIFDTDERVIKKILLTLAENEKVRFLNEITDAEFNSKIRKWMDTITDEQDSAVFRAIEQKIKKRDKDES